MARRNIYVQPKNEPVFQQLADLGVLSAVIALAVEDYLALHPEVLRYEPPILPRRRGPHDDAPHPGKR